MDKRLVKNASLHGVLHIPGVGQIGPSLPPQNKSLPNLKMYRLPDGAVELAWGAGTLKYSYVVGAATVQGCYLEPETVGPALVEPTKAS